MLNPKEGVKRTKTSSSHNTTRTNQHCWLLPINQHYCQLPITMPNFHLPDRVETFQPEIFKFACRIVNLGQTLFEVFHGKKSDFLQEKSHHKDILVWSISPVTSQRSLLYHNMATRNQSLTLGKDF